MPEKKKPTPLALSIRHENAKEQTPDLKTGWVVVVILKQPLYVDMRAWVGQVQQCSAIGIRITAIDWFTGFFTGSDFLFQWTDIAGVEVFTDKHDLTHVDLGGKQSRYNGATPEDRKA